MARNKRLHVELALIKLNYLKQAIDLINDNGSVIKKKRVDGPVIHQTKTIASSAQQKAKASGSKLFVQEPAAKNGSSNNITEVPTNTLQELSTSYQKPKKDPDGAKKNLLDALRDKYGDKYVIEEVKEAETLSLAKLNSLWLEYTAKLELQPNKHSTVQTFKSAQLKIDTDNFFIITVSAVTQQKFIEQEKTMLCDFMQQAFNNRSINFKIVVEEGIKQEIPIHLTLNSRQKFERIAEKYPLVKELKNRLNLDLDY
jgi:DNA polymerase-3 subunit gamma/tau